MAASKFTPSAALPNWPNFATELERGPQGASVAGVTEEEAPLNLGIRETIFDRVLTRNHKLVSRDDCEQPNRITNEGEE